MRDAENLYASRERFLYYKKHLIIDNLDPIVNRNLLKELYLEDTTYVTLLEKFKRLIKKPILPHSYNPTTSDKFFLLASNRNSTGYFHFVTEFLTSLVWLHYVNISNYKLVLPSVLKVEWILQYLEIFDVGEVCWLNSRSMINHCWIVAATAIQGSYDGDEIRRLRTLMHYRCLKDSPYPDAYQLKIIISRNDADSRRIINQDSLYQKLKGFGFIILQMSDLSVQKQVSLFAQATHVVAPHGAGLTNILWMQANTYVYEIRASTNINDNCYFSLAQHLNLQYTAIEAEKRDKDYYIPDSNIDRLVALIQQDL